MTKEGGSGDEKPQAQEKKKRQPQNGRPRVNPPEEKKRELLEGGEGM